MMAETETGVPKLGCTPWPYGRADDSAGTDQREDRLGSYGQTRDKWNIEEADQNTTHGSRNFQHRQRTESPLSINLLVVYRESVNLIGYLTRRP